MSNNRVAAAQFSSSSLSSSLVALLSNTSRNIWLGCISPTISDVDATEKTLNLLENIRLLTLRSPWRARYAGFSDREFEFHNLTRQPIETRGNRCEELCVRFLDESSSTRARIESTKLIAERRKNWLNDTGMSSERRDTNGPFLVNINRNVGMLPLPAGDVSVLFALLASIWCLQASISHRLFVQLDCEKTIFGSQTRGGIEQPGYNFIRLGNAGVLPVHCEILRSRGSSIALEARQDALVSINGVRMLDCTRKLNTGDLILIGQKALFGLNMGLAGGPVGSYDLGVSIS